MSEREAIVGPNTQAQAQAGVAELDGSEVRAWARKQVATAPPIGAGSVLILVTAFTEALAAGGVAA